MPNHLSAATSPYLLQHQDNPVDWYPWCDEALDRARAEQKPIFLSIGYSACHWCHVMEHESFEDAEIAAFLNEHFISIKVDREERPDLDHVYMAAVQMMTGRGGWPLSVFLTPELKPFYGGTYWPPRGRHGLPGFMEVLRAVADAWSQRRVQAEDMASQLSEQLVQIEHPARTGQSLPNAERWQGVIERLATEYDRRHGGFGGAPKFPQPMVLEALLRDFCRTGSASSIEMASHTLRQMFRGGIYDHLGGGFARYSVDAEWLVPHFEKMLYDNALLAGVYLRAWQITGDSDFRAVTEETLRYVLRDMRLADGGFAASEDADSDGEEGKFYTWSWQALKEALGSDVDDFATVYGASEEGNWEGTNILHLCRSWEETARRWETDVTEVRQWFSERRARLLEFRDQRIRPGRDDKVIVSWNAMVIGALADAGEALDESSYVEAAVEAAEFLRHTLVDSAGRLRHSWREGTWGVEAFADDHALLIDASIRLYQATGNTAWLEWAHELARQLETLFADPDHGGFFLTGSDVPHVWVRPKPVTDSSVPSANNAAATALARLGALLGDPHWTDLARDAVRSALIYLDRAPLAAGQALIALDWLIGPTWTAVLSEPFGSEAWLDAKPCARGWHPRTQFVWRVDADEDARDLLASLLAGKTADSSANEGDRLALYACAEGACEPPRVGREAVRAWLVERACSSGVAGAGEDCKGRR